VRIAIDARELQGRATGVGAYLGGILTAWDTLPAAAAHEFILCKPESAGGTWWEQRVLPRLIRQARADVLFAPGYTAPLFAGVPTVVAIHDVSFAAHPEWFGWREGATVRVPPLEHLVKMRRGSFPPPLKRRRDLAVTRLRRAKAGQPATR
jgi:hypothetical protein